MSGRVILMGSGELAPGLVATHRAGLEAAGTDRVVVIDTPYGFQENADQITERIVSFFETSLRTDVTVATLRQEKADAVARERFLATLRSARYVFSGPGSPSYALRVWNSDGIGAALQSVVAAGGTLTFASAASLTLGRATLPVYEIYKVGAPPSWLPGLDVMSVLGFPCTVVPHWNNSEGGNHDTSRCYVGQRRFSELARGLDVGVLGVDEHTAATLDFGARTMTVTGAGLATLRGEIEITVPAGSTMPMDEALDALDATSTAHSVAATQDPPAASLEEAIARRDTDAALAALLAAEQSAPTSPEARRIFRSQLVRIVDEAAVGLTDPRERVGGFVDLLLRVRDAARGNRDFATADLIRDGLVGLGIEVRDTGDGTEWDLASD